MRNGNFSIFVIGTRALFRSYPTYEEWKHFSISLITFYLLFQVLILPMRNGNDIPEIIFISPSGKSSYPTYEEWKLILFY